MKDKQKTYTVKKSFVNQKIDLFVMIQLDEFMNALNDLSGNAFKIWAYMAKNKEGYTEQLSSKYVMEKCGFKKTAYDNGIDELIEKGYLIDDNKHHDSKSTTNYWLFYATPLKDMESKQPILSFKPPPPKPKKSRLEQIQNDDDFTNIEWYAKAP